MATQRFTRFFLAKPQAFVNLLSRPSATSHSSHSLSTFSILGCLRPIYSAVSITTSTSDILCHSQRAFSTRATSSSLNDPNPNWSNRPPKETILLDGCDFEHWLVVMEKPEGDPTRDEIIDSYIKTLAQVVGSEEEARMKIYSVSTRHYYAFGALVSEELSYKLKELPRVRWVLPDSYLDVKNKDYGGEPFINGQAVPYDPKYHEEWVRNNARAQERNRRNDRPRNNDRSRNFERRRENFQNRPNQAMQNTGPNMGVTPPPHPNLGGVAPTTPNMPQHQPPPPNNMPPYPPPNSVPPRPQHMGGMPQQAPPQMGGMPQQQPPPQMGRMPQQQPPPQMVGGVPHQQTPPHMHHGHMPPNAGHENMQNFQQGDYQQSYAPNNYGDSIRGGN